MDKPLLPVKPGNSDPLELILGKQEDKNVDPVKRQEPTNNVEERFTNGLLRLGYNKRFKSKKEILNAGILRFLHEFSVEPCFWKRANGFYYKKTSAPLSLDDFTQGLINLNLVDNKYKANAIVDILKNNKNDLRDFGSKYSMYLEEVRDGLGNPIYLLGAKHYHF